MTDKPIHNSIKQKLKNISQNTGESFNYLFTRLTLERFIARVEQSEYKNNLIFKGGYCLNNIIKIGRETNDIDFLIKNMEAGVEEVSKIFSNISEVFIDDGYSFSNVVVSVLPINKKYPGYRIELNYSFGNARNKIHIDTGVGDIVEPIMLTLNMLKNQKGNLFQDQIQVLSYPPEYIFSEKYHAAVFLGEVNSRLKDYHDMFLLIDSGVINPEFLKKSIKRTFDNRDTKISLIPEFSQVITEKFQAQWKQHLINVDEEVKIKLPGQFDRLINRINEYLKSNKII